MAEEEQPNTSNNRMFQRTMVKTEAKLSLYDLNKAQTAWRYSWASRLQPPLSKGRNSCLVHAVLRSAKEEFPILLYRGSLLTGYGCLNYKENNLTLFSLL
ncbi:hypothetical protein BaRGS_00023574 [Batillaria attramentaria]|uniref:Uncharacterized protein n=1 Tax=Batillaria attramentaria TaxID=370345 RepID=A0ABD0KDD6_9CAEN